MERILTLKLILLAKFLSILSPSLADTYSVKISTESHVNLVDNRFLSFTIDPKYLFSSNGKYDSKECICMASSLTPAYVRIAGPSTGHTTFHNTTISIEAQKAIEGNAPRTVSLNEAPTRSKSRDELSVSHEEWEKFIRWAKETGFDLVFALNNEEITPTGMWDPNTALNILTVADKADVGDIFWQLGYECRNQSIEEYLNDLETLRVISETFPSGQAGRWRVVAGDVTPCLKAASKSDFKDYVALSDELLDAVFLNGNSSSQELERMSEKDRLKLLKVLSKSDTPLWLTETNHRFHELERAADWMTSLGYAARNGFSVHFRELVEMEIYEPTLSFYMALLFKNLVGEKVLNVDIEASEAILFAHCTSLRHKPVPGAVTLFGANMDNEPARFSVKLSKKEEGGDIMQFILGHDHSGNIVVNGRPMYYEGDIKPVVKRVRPYKTLLINLPPKSFGFWVLANTQVEACYDSDEEKPKQYVEAASVESDDTYSVAKTKRSIDKYDIKYKESTKEIKELLNKTHTNSKPQQQELETRIDEINEELSNGNIIFPAYFDVGNPNINSNKVKRAYDTDSQDQRRKKLRRHGLRSRNKKQRNNHDSLFNSDLLSKLRNSKLGRKLSGRSRVSKRNSKGLKGTLKLKKANVNSIEKSFTRRKVDKDVAETPLKNPDCDSLRKRKRRSVIESGETEEINKENNQMSESILRKPRKIIHNNHLADTEDLTSENDLNDDGVLSLGKVLHKLKKVARLPIEIHEKYGDQNDDYSQETTDMEGIVLKTKLLGDSATINISENSKNGFLRSTIEDILSLLSDLNTNVSKVWTALTFLE